MSQLSNTEILQIVNICISTIVPVLALFILRITHSECCGMRVDRKTSASSDDEVTPIVPKGVRFKVVDPNKK